MFHHEKPAVDHQPVSLDMQALGERSALTILVLSDTHGSLRIFDMVLEKLAPFDLILHLGDHAAPFSELKLLTDVPILGVAGNCDGHISGDLPESLRIRLAGYNVFMTHGHRFHVKHDLKDLAATAMAAPVNADLVLFGHTHHYMETSIDRNDGRSTTFLNPGSACLSPFNPHPSCAQVHLLAGGIEITKWTPPETE